MRGKYKLAIGVVVLIALFFLLCYEQYSVPEGIKGTIFVISEDTYAYSPSEDVITEIRKPGRRFQPSFQCKIAPDTFVVLSQNPLKSPDGFLGYYKVVPFESRIERIDELGDYVWLAKRLDYNADLKLFLFYGGLNSDTIGLYILDTAFNVVKDISYIIYSFEIPTSVGNFYLLDSTTIIFNHTYQEVYEYSLIDSTSRIIANGRLEAISHNRSMIVLSVGYSDDKLNHLFHLSGDDLIKLPPIIDPGGFSFSPNDSFIACLNATDDLYSTVELYIYEIKTNKMYKTGATGGGDLVWVNQEN